MKNTLPYPKIILASLILAFAFGVAPSFVQAQSSQTYQLTVSNGTGGGFYTAGTVVSITANVPAGKVFDYWTDAVVPELNWLLVPVASKTSQTTTLTMPAGAAFVDAKYKVASLQVSITSPQNGANLTVGTSFSVSGQITGGQPPYNYSIVFENNRSTAPTWSSNTVFANFTPTSSGQQKPITFYIEDSNGAHIAETSITVNVSAAPPPATYQLTVSDGTGGGFYTAGTVVSITANAAPTGQVFDRWTGATVANPTSQTTTLTMPAGAATVTATYKAITVTAYAVSILKSGTGSGIVTSAGSINCGSVCNSSGTAGMTVNLSATEASDSTFSGWSGGACAGSTIASCSFTLNTDTTVTATFTAVVVEPPPPVTVSPENPGDSVREVVVTSPPPTLSTLSKHTYPATPDGASITITGTGFTSGDTNIVHLVQALSGEGTYNVPASYVSPTMLTFVLPADLLFGRYNVSVENSRGQSVNVPPIQMWPETSSRAPAPGGGDTTPPLVDTTPPPPDDTKLDSGSDSTGITDGCGGPLFLSLSGFLTRIQCILNLFIPFIIGLAMFVILFGIFLYVAKADNEEKRQEGRRFVIWGLVGLFFMLSVWGFVNILLNTLDIERTIQPGDIPVVPTVVRTPVP